MLTLLHLLSSIALLVWGTHIVRTGIMRVYGSHLRRMLGQSMGNAPLAFGAGIGVTAPDFVLPDVTAAPSQRSFQGIRVSGSAR